MLAVSSWQNRKSDFTQKQRTKLTQCFDKLNLLSFEPLISAQHGLGMVNTITIPYSTSFHYLPRTPARDVAFLPRTASSTFTRNSPEDEQGRKRRRRSISRRRAGRKVLTALCGRRRS